jgi:coproporphyrinogen III oxidase
MDIEEKKLLTSDWFRELRDKFCEEFEDIDNANFERKYWDHKFDGGGEMSLMKGDVFEKVGVNISTVSGQFDKDFKSEVKGTEETPNYWASGISLVAHMHSPLVPAFHFNTRFIVTGDSWFGGGGDITPTIVPEDDVHFFHQCMKEACDKADPDYYQKYKKACDEYFYLPHRAEARGEGGIFIDHLETDDWDKDFSFIQEVGLSTLKAISTIIRNLKDGSWTEEQKNQQLIKRGRYVEFNLIWDRGTSFGLKTGGNTDAILMSMPPNAKWD